MYPVPPDPTDALIAFLKTDPPITAISGDRVSTTRIDTAQPRIQITMLPGAVTEPFEQNTEYQLDCWGGTERQAKTLARTVVTRIYGMRGALDGGAVTTARPSLMPFDSPDPVTGRPRSICQVEITISPEAPS